MPDQQEISTYLSFPPERLLQLHHFGVCKLLEFSLLAWLGWAALILCREPPDPGASAAEGLLSASELAADGCCASNPVSAASLRCDSAVDAAVALSVCDCSPSSSC